MRPLAVAALLCAPAGAAPPKDYAPSAETAAGLSVPAARKAFRGFLTREPTAELSTFSAATVTGARITREGLDFDYKGGGSESIPWSKLELLVHVRKSEVKLRRGFKFYCADKAEAEKLGNALFVLKRAHSPEAAAEEESAFQAALSKLRDAKEKPAFPEAARRFRVQAEAALREKRFDDAADHYAEALAAAPWWLEARFNRALILGDLERHPEAVKEMRRYLALAPDAPNARAAQDKIYEWEANTP